MADVWSTDFWSQPWFAPYVAEDFRSFQDWPPLAAYDDALRARGVVNCRGQELLTECSRPIGKRLRAQGQKPSPLAYEQSIHDAARLPTRPETWHDFFNLLVWLRFPRTKAMLNRRQIASGPWQGRRTTEQDRLTSFDEGGVILLSDKPEQLADALNCPINDRPAAAHELNTDVVVFGHGIFECVVKSGFTAITAMAWIVPVRAPWSLVDELLAAMIERQELQPSDGSRRGFPLANHFASISTGGSLGGD